MKIADVKPVWVAWTNTDLTEGRGYKIPYAVCENPITAERKSKGNSVQGSNCNITEEIAVKIGNRWLAPCRIIPADVTDIEIAKKRAAKEAALAKARDAGLTEEELNLLK